MTPKSRVFLLVSLPLTIIAVVFWQTMPSPAQERQQRLNSAILATDDPVEIRDLIRQGADPNYCEQPSSWAKLQSHYPFLCLITHSAGTPIYQPALETWTCVGQVNAVKALLAGGANPQQKDSIGQTALEAAHEKVASSYRRPGIPNSSDKILWMLERAEAKLVLKGPPAGAR